MASKKKSSNSDGTSTLELAFPIKGINKTAAWHKQPPGTTPDCLNVIPYDVYGGRPML